LIQPRRSASQANSPLPKGNRNAFKLGVTAAEVVDLKKRYAPSPGWPARYVPLLWAVPDRPIVKPVAFHPCNSTRCAPMPNARLAYLADGRCSRLQPKFVGKTQEIQELAWEDSAMPPTSDTLPVRPRRLRAKFTSPSAGRQRCGRDSSFAASSRAASRLRLPRNRLVNRRLGMEGCAHCRSFARRLRRRRARRGS
jgi:hypothetical protein